MLTLARYGLVGSVRPTPAGLPGARNVERDGAGFGRPTFGCAVMRPEGPRHARRIIGKRWATYPANLCPFRCGGAASHSRPRRTILPNESGNSKRFVTTDYQPPELRPNRAARAPSDKTTRTKRINEGLSTGR